MGLHRALFLWWPLLMVSVTVSLAQENAYRFINSQASSTHGPQFDALQAIQAGQGYWSSSGHHSNDEEVTWTGFFSAPAYLKGLRVRWAYSPEEVQVSVSPDGANWNIAMPYKRTPSNDVAFNEEMVFDHPHTAKAVKISMRKAIHDFFGINEVVPLSAGEPLAMLISGITSETGEMCLQVEGGQYNQEGATVVLDRCASAFAAGDGRELWRTNANQQFIAARSKPPKCMTLQDGNTAEGGNIVLVDCLHALEEADGRSSWTVEANSQLRLQRTGSFCLTLEDIHGNQPGVGDIARSFGASATSSSVADEAHSPAKAVDGDPTSYWASGAFGDADHHQVEFDINLGKPATVSGVSIDWEYPALAYRIEGSLDGHAFSEFASNVANPSNSTLEVFAGREAQVIRIALLQPHSKHGKVGDKYVYGIRGVEVLANRLQTVVGDCREAANSADARDKFFVESTSAFDPAFADKVSSMDYDVIDRTRALGKKTEELYTALPHAKTCVSQKKDYGERLKKAKAESSTIAGQYDYFTQLQSSKPVTHPELSPGALHQATLGSGDSASYPAEDCYAVKSQDPAAASGFYWILPRCAPEPLRVYCDMKSATSMFFWNGAPGAKPAGNINDKVDSLGSIRLRCAEVGLEPLVLRSADHLQAVKDAIELIGYSGSGVIPLAYDYGCINGRCTGSFRDLYSGSTDLTALLMSQSSLSTELGRMTPAAGVGLAGSETSYFDMDTSDIAGIVCSTNAMEGEDVLPHVDISCDATAGEHEAFRGILNTNVVVECPPGCEEHSTLPVYGTGGVYSDSSSVCRAAIHAGVLKSGGVVSVSLESPRESYEGSSRNGVKSKSLNTPNMVELVNLVTGEALRGELPSRSRGVSLRSIRVGPVARDCPIESFAAPASSFIELSSSVSLEAGSEVSETPIEKQEDVMLDPAVALVIQQMLKEMDAIHGVDPAAVFASQAEAAEAVRQVKKYLKAAELLQRKQTGETEELYVEGEDLMTRVLAESGRYFNKLEEFYVKLERAEEERLEEAGFSSFQVNYEAMPFSQTFVLFDTLRTKNGPSSWGYSEDAVAGHKNTIVQTSGILGTQDGEGTFAMLKGRRFFDFVALADFYAVGSGSVGVAVRMRDPNNLFLFEANKERGYKRLMRIDKGDAIIIAQKDDGGYDEAKWYRLRIEATHGYIRVCFGEPDSNLGEVFSVLDERFLSGSLGLYSSGMDGGVFFDNIRVKAKACSHISKEAPPLPPRCARFTEMYLEQPGALYETVSLRDVDNKGAWLYKAHVAGRKKALQPPDPADDGASRSTAVLRSPKLCKDGNFLFDFHHACPGGVVGAIFRYQTPSQHHVVEVTGSQMTLYRVENNTKSTIASKAIKPHIGEWNTMELQFDGRHVVALLSTADGHQESLRATLPDRGGHGHVGLLSANCRQHAFDRLAVSPPKILEETASHGHLSREKAWVVCPRSVHLLQRRSECEKMAPNKSGVHQLECTSQFCEQCCHYHTALLGKGEEDACRNTCRKNVPIVERLQTNFIGKLRQCMDVNGDAFSHCTEEDLGCPLEACNFCCATSEGAEDINGIPKSLVEGLSTAETEECKFQCSRKFD
ncbi:F5/8 type C domain-containing protein [Besnoitia besnoiti]|uniref:F5/8 type C domain-containing protein n=1 Tax=Besnoitia besnoiti TaxID=94643 RepID=A0A2A9MNY8_BESBE|nr:F5/8 type C domain-containing protein [Besnoitia besnoiti]PFH37677.1 F5/8 type C domain-containing protein [Besnoitia besnoiti]